MKTGPSETALLDFIKQANESGRIPTATAQALNVAIRNVFSVLDDREGANLPIHDLDDIIRRFSDARAADLNPKSLTEYARRVKRAVELYEQWISDSANFTVKTRATQSLKRIARANMPATTTDFNTAIALRPGHVVTVSNLPLDLTSAEAERLAQFIRLLGSD